MLKTRSGLGNAYVCICIHVCIYEEFIFVCGLIPEVLTDCLCSVNTPLGGSFVLSKVCRNVEVLVSGMCLPIDMLVLPISNFGVVLGMN